MSTRERLKGVLSDAVATGEQEVDIRWSAAALARSSARFERWVDQILEIVADQDVKPEPVPVGGPIDVTGVSDSTAGIDALMRSASYIAYQRLDEKPAAPKSPPTATVNGKPSQRLMGENDSAWLQRLVDESPRGSRIVLRGTWDYTASLRLTGLDDFTLWYEETRP